MNSTLVSARVPAAKRERAKSVLASLGATTSDLINSAFDYVLAERKLPNASEESTPTADDFQAFVASSSLSVEWPADFDGDYRALITRMRQEDYESLS